MTVEESSAAPAEQPEGDGLAEPSTAAPAAASPPPPTQPPTASQLALDRYRTGMRRRLTWYYGAIAVVVAALAVTVAVAWSHGEIAHTTLRTAATPAPSVALQSPAATLRQAWRSDDATAIGTPYWGGTVVTYSADSVRGRNAATGAVTWSYTRTDRHVCQAIQDQGVTVAVFELHGNCDQLTALDSATGERKWSRTLDKDGMPLDGHPTYSVAQYTIMFTTPGVIYAIDPGGGLDRWTFHQKGCAITSAVFGTQGALISQNCSAPECDGLKFCGAGQQLLLRDATAGRSDDDKQKDNPDQIKWNLIGSPLVPASADQLISAVDTSAHELQVLDVAKGAIKARLALQGGAVSTVVQQATARAELLWVGGVTYAVDVAGSDFTWVAATAGPPVVTARPGATDGGTDLARSTVAVVDQAGIVLLDPATGRVTRTYPAGAAAGGRAYPLGSGFVLAGASTAVYA